MITRYNALILSYMLLAAASQTASALVRNRVHVQDGTVVADDGNLLRFGSDGVGNDNAPGGSVTDVNYWKTARDTGHLNGIRVLAYTGQWAPNIYKTGGHMDLAHLLPVLDQAVAAASATGMYVLIDNHSDCCTGENLTDDTAFWSAIAPRYANDTNVFYELKNEPNQPADPTSYVNYETTIYHLIRSAAPSTHIVLWSPTDPVGVSANPLQYFSPGVFGDPNASFGFHAYGKSGNVSKFEQVIMTLRQHYPVITTELDQDPAAGQADPNVLFAWYESQGISWAILGADTIYADAPGKNSMGHTVTWPFDPGTLAASGKPTISSFSASPNAITSGQSTTLSWTTTGATSLSIDNGIGDVSSKTSISVSPTTTTTYTLTATNSIGTVTAQTAVTVGASGNPGVPMAASNLTGYSPDTSSVVLNWKDNSNNETGFIIQRRATNGGLPFATVTTLGANVVTYTDAGLTDNWQYDYQVIATNASGNAAPSNTVTVQVGVTKQANPCDLNGDGSVTVADVQLAVNKVLGVTTPCGTADINEDGQCTVADVQRIVNAVLGGVCKVGP